MHVAEFKRLGGCAGLFGQAGPRCSACWDVPDTGGAWTRSSFQGQPVGLLACFSRECPSGRF